MSISPYLHFNGNCAEAVELYKKAFSAKVLRITQYKDLPQSEGYEFPAGTENFVMNGEIQIGDSTIMLADCPPEHPTTFSDGINIHVYLNAKEDIETAFNTLADSGQVTMPLEKTFWSESFGMVTDKFGVCWMLSMPMQHSFN